jgi:hypothetical protein
MWLWREGQKISTLDLLDKELVLLTGPVGAPWRTAPTQAARSLGVPLRCEVLGVDGPLVDRTGEWAALYGVDENGAVLVRPDGHVAWRSARSDRSGTSGITEVIRRVVSRQ